MKLALKLIAKEKKERTGRLDLGNCGLTELPVELFELTWLEELQISNSYWDWSQKEWIESKNKEGSNKISFLGEGFRQLKSIKKLWICGDYQVSWQIRDIRFLENLTNLQSLNLSSNQISDIRFLENLTNLESLDLSSNKISDIRFLENLTNLQFLDLSSNQISDIRFLKNLTNLLMLDLSSNQISDLAALKKLILDQKIDVSMDEYGFGIRIYNNPLNSPPPEIIKQGRSAIMKYFKELEEQGKDYLFEAKLLILGEGRVGKTTLLRKLQDAKALLPEDERDTTHGIDIEVNDTFFKTRDGNNLTIHFWDFGGQAIYHATHQFFLTRRSLYIIVDDASRDDIDLDYWFQVIEKLTGNSPVILVQNCKAGRIKDIDIRGLREHYLNLNEPVIYFDFSLGKDQDKDNLNILRKIIQNQIELLPHVGQELPKNWVSIRKRLQELENEKAFISLEDYLSVCRNNSIDDYSKAIDLSTFYHDLGVFLHFNSDPILRQTVILQKEWATKAVYMLLDANELKVKMGRFCFKDATSVWKDNTYLEKHHELLELMKKFELIYNLPGRDHNEYIAPQLLPESQPESYSWNPVDNLRMIYEYDFMPKGLLSRFIVRMNRFVDDKQIPDTAWKRGVKLFRDNTCAEIKEIYGSKKIEVRVEGSHRKEFMTLITDDLDQLNETFNNLQPEKLIPCNCRECKKREKELIMEKDVRKREKLNQPHFYKFSNLRYRQEKGKPMVECDVSFETFIINELLDDVIVKREEAKEPLKLFISYAKEDIDLKNKLIDHLSVYIRNKYLIIWDDELLHSGSWDEQIKLNLEESDVVLFLVSSQYLSTRKEYVWDVEIPLAFMKDPSRLIPVILSPCAWNDSQLGQLQALPDKAKPVTIWENENEAFLSVVKRIMSFINYVGIHRRNIFRGLP